LTSQLYVTQNEGVFGVGGTLNPSAQTVIQDFHNGMTGINTLNSGTLNYFMPSATTSQGFKVTFLRTSSSNQIAIKLISPNLADRFINPADGLQYQQVVSTAVGDSITFISDTAGLWYVQSTPIGTWTFS